MGSKDTLRDPAGEGAGEVGGQAGEPLLKWKEAAPSQPTSNGSQHQDGSQLPLKPLLSVVDDYDAASSGGDPNLGVPSDGGPPTSGQEGGEGGEGGEDEEALLQDRGWAWVVCLGCFLSHVVTGGFERSDGVMFLEFSHKFQESAQMTAWPSAICSTVRLCMGPLSTAMCNRFSARAAVMVGTVGFSLGLIVSGWAPNVLFLFFSYGFLQGVGRGLIYAPGLVIVGMYFNKRRGLGVGLATAGVGAGTFIFPPLVGWLFQEFGFQGALLILGGIACNSFVVGATFRPLFMHRKIVLGARNKAKDEEKAVCGTLKDEAKTANDHGKISTQQTPDIQERTESDNAETNVVKRRTTHQSLAVRILKSTLTTCFPTETQRKTGAKRKLIEWSLLKIPAFVFYCFSICLFTLAFKSAFTFLPALAESKGMTAIESGYLLSISGVLDTVGRISAGLVLDIPHIRPFRPVVYNSVVFLIVGLSFLSPFLDTFLQFAALFGLYGLLTGVYVSQKSVILVDILGQDKLNSSFGIMIFFQGIGVFIGPPLSGFLKDVFGRYHEAFFLGGAAMAVAGLLMIVSNMYRIRHNRAHAEESNTTTLVVQP